ncbi:hypothetical protein V5O48_007719 [Marasmius crinis-equi]|uniref:Chromo domain-containing protein n=1 Tax=Marasmius crinis-equi TaxID=585013 RepID=A0ABR3FGD7_9AGAR
MPKKTAATSGRDAPYPQAPPTLNTRDKKKQNGANNKLLRACLERLRQQCGLPKVARRPANVVGRLKGQGPYLGDSAGVLDGNDPTYEYLGQWYWRTPDGTTWTEGRQIPRQVLDADDELQTLLLARALLKDGRRPTSATVVDEDDNSPPPPAVRWGPNTDHTRRRAEKSSIRCSTSSAPARKEVVRLPPCPSSSSKSKSHVGRTVADVILISDDDDDDDELAQWPGSDDTFVPSSDPTLRYNDDDVVFVEKKGKYLATCVGHVNDEPSYWVTVIAWVKEYETPTTLRVRVKESNAGFLCLNDIKEELGRIGVERPLGVHRYCPNTGFWEAIQWGTPFRIEEHGLVGLRLNTIKLTRMKDWANYRIHSFANAK